MEVDRVQPERGGAQATARTDTWNDIRMDGNYTPVFQGPILSAGSGTRRSC